MLITNVTRVALAIALVGLGAGCSKAPKPEAKESNGGQVAATEIKVAARIEGTADIERKPAIAENLPNDVSTIVGKSDIMVRGKPACKIDFVYAGFEPEDLLWDGEACTNLTAKLVDQTELERLGKWPRLADFEQRHVSELPGGKVLYVEGQFTASVYPVGTTRLSYEVSVAD